MGIQLPTEKGHNSPQFSTHVYCAQTAGCIKMPLGTKVGLGPGDIVLDGNPSLPLLERGIAVPTIRTMTFVGKRLDRSRCHLVRR